MSTLEPLGPEARGLIEDADGVDRATGADKDRIRKRLAVQIGAAAFGSAAGAAGVAKASGGAAGGAALVAKLIGGAAVVSAVAIGAFTVGRHEAEATHPPATTTAASHDEGTPAPASSDTAPVAPVEVAPPPAVAEPPRVAPAPPAPRGPRPTQGAPAATTAPPPAAPSASVKPTETEGEAALLSRAQAALAAGDGLTALEILDMHARKYPNGVLADQRETDRVLAICAIGRVAAAREAAERFLAAHPRSAQAARVRKACGVP
jgi:type IV secretory pathway VirB10-like protein